MPSVQNDFRCHILRRATESPRFTAVTDELGESKVDLQNKICESAVIAL